jgi:hypothetical protein
MLPQENRLFGCAWPEPSQGSVPAGLALASDFSFCFQYKVGSSLVLRRPIEITALIGNYDPTVGDQAPAPRHLSHTPRSSSFNSSKCRSR